MKPRTRSSAAARGEAGAAGSQRLQARKPAAVAAAASSKNLTWRRSGRRDGQLGRQKTPVERTA